MSLKILVGLSGGVDSAVSAYLLKQQGYDVTAGFMINYLAPEGEVCPTREDIEVAKEVAACLEIPFFTFDYRDEYEQKVLYYMYEGYKQGITPNPDIMCNSEIKFKVFLDEALSLGFDMVATGHYAQVAEREKGKEKSYHLLKGKDPLKDQSYFLAGLNQEQLSRALFPIGHLEKKEVRQIAKEAGLPNAERKDSQGICFVGKVDMATFLEKKIAPKPGNIVDTAGNILGQHRGVYYYTIGQRKGLDIGGLAEPVFVVRKDIERNELIVGTDADMELRSEELEMQYVHFLNKPSQTSPLAPLLTGEGKLEAKAKIRYRQEDQECTISILHPPHSSRTSFTTKGRGEIYKVKFKEPQRAIASGQICAVYLGEELVMSGVIV